MLTSNLSLPSALYEQAGFRCRKSIVDQITMLMQSIKDASEAKKTGAVFINLTAAYDTVWYHGFALNKHMVCTIMELVQNESFSLTTDDIKSTWLQCMNNGIIQGSILLPFLFNINI